MRTANALFSFFMAVGNVLGYAAGSLKSLYKIFPFTTTKACDVYCANLKSCFFISICLLLVLTILALTAVKEKPYDKNAMGTGAAGGAMFCEIFRSFLQLKKPMWILLLVTCLNWVAWFGFLLFDTDWMGKEVYGGVVGKGRLYEMGVRAGSLGLMLNAFVLVVTKMAENYRHANPTVGGAEPLPPPAGVKAGALLIFATLGIPQAVTFSIPFAMASIFCSNSGAGQDVCISVISGPLDASFGGGNLPAFVLGAVALVISGILALVVLPSPPPDHATPTVIPAGIH
ncbi:hypothetical protein ACLB2K_018369 [Fragaria x ananassa]